MSTLVLALLALTPAADPPKPADLPRPVESTAAEDHKKMMALLGIKELRRGADGNNKSAPNAANSDESKATPYKKLPDPLMFDDGKPVKTAADWTKRRAEIVEHFDREVYGRVPKTVPGVKWAVKETTKDKSGDIDTTTKKLVGVVDNSSYPHVKVEIQLSVTTPVNASGPVPLMMEFGFSFGGGGGGALGGPKPWTQQLIEKGWGYAIISPGSIQADSGGSGSSDSVVLADSQFDRLLKSYSGTGDTLDYAKVSEDARSRFDRFAKIGNEPELPKTGTVTRADHRKEYAKRQEEKRKKFGETAVASSYQGLTTGIIGLCNKGQPRQPDDWGALRAWAWGASRALDYLETDKDVDAKQVGIEGLSRYGKAAVVAMAYDERFAIGLIGSSGQGGAKIIRRDFGEKVENVASSGEYHWMAGNYIKYAGPKTAEDLPVDAHHLVALCAPRPTFISVGSLKVEGTWIDAKGSFLAGLEAGPVYKLLGKKDYGTTVFPEEKVGLTDGDIAFRMHEGGHTVGPNWPTFLTWADRFIKAPKK